MPPLKINVLYQITVKHTFTFPVNSTVNYFELERLGLSVPEL